MNVNRVISSQAVKRIKTITERSYRCILKVEEMALSELYMQLNKEILNNFSLRFEGNSNGLNTMATPLRAEKFPLNLCLIRSHCKFIMCYYVIWNAFRSRVIYPVHFSLRL